MNRAVSVEAQFIDETTREDRSILQESSAFGIEQLLRHELAETWVECQQPDWDGYGALPVSQEAMLNMRDFLIVLPLGIHHPSIGADPCGHLSAEWYRSPRRVLSVTVSSDMLLHYAALLGPNKTCGTETFYDEVPDTILNLVRRVYS
jgi:hypothetical protein